jgi:vitamin B12 transporter
VTLEQFTVLNLAADYRISPRWQLYGRIDNALDEEYEEWFGYRSPGRTVAAGVSAALAR